MDKLDSNKDGTIDKSELAKALKSYRGRHHHNHSDVAATSQASTATSQTAGVTATT